VLVGGLLTPGSAATGPGAPAGWAVIDVSPPDRPIVLPAAVLATLADDRARDEQRVTPNGTQLFRISATSGHDLPEAARRAYERAARQIERTRPGCGLPWGLLAGIGRVESDHGRYGGSRLGVDGVSKPRIRGIALDGVGPVAAIPDTDGGRLDGDEVWDRAVGPMQFIPSTWATAGVDGDGDGVADPDDLDDAALAAAGYLCPASGPIGDEAGMRAAVFTYNHSAYYVDLVMAFAIGYTTGVFDIPSPPVEAEPESVEPVAELPETSSAAGARDPEPRPPRDPEPPASAPDAPRPPQPQPQPQPQPPRDPEPTRPPAPVTPTPTPEPDAPVLTSVSGPWTACDGGWCLAGYPLDLGPDTQLAARAASDLDGDGTIATNRIELDGLVGRTVAAQLERGTALVYTLQGLGYRNADGGFAS
jgi:hypothetical protein